MRRSLSSSCFALGLTLTACGSLDANTGSAPALATIRGQLVNPTSMSVTGAVRVAVVWQAGSAGQFNVAEDLPVQPVFPSSFSIDLDGPPPASALLDGAGFFRTGGGATPPTTGTGSVPSAPTQSTLSRRPTPRTSSSDLQVAIGTVVAYLDLSSGSPRGGT